VSGAGPSTENPLPMSSACSKRKHEECPGVVLGGHLGPTVPCSCRCHRLARTEER
jgi:hypothetical protein